jgi:spoIIIJ-associated protein
MKTVTMKGKNVEEATKAAAAVLGVAEEKLTIKVIKEGKSGMMGLIGGEEAEVEATLAGSFAEEANQVLQNLLDKMGLMAISNVAKADEEGVSLDVKGEDMGRIIGKEGAMLKSLEIVVGTMTQKLTNTKSRVRIDAGGYKDKREKVLEKLAKEVAEEVASTGVEKELPPMEAADRRIIHISLKDDAQTETYSKGEGRDRRLVVAPKK